LIVEGNRPKRRGGNMGDALFLIGVGRVGYPAPPPSEPYVRFSRIRLSG